MFAFRDPFGIKPIILGRRQTADGSTFYAVASESVVLDVSGYEIVRDLAAGEALWIGRDRKPHFMQVGTKPHRPCIFEYIYFARPDSVLDGASVYHSRLVMGRKSRRVLEGNQARGRRGDPGARVRRARRRRRWPRRSACPTARAS
jgi:amidophosphoribosyltransferase